jgi:isoleucyl-tRNA synthetase
VMRLTSLGHAARNKANRKVRQPLSEVAFAVSTREEEQAITKYADLLEDELNVKKVRSLNSASEAVSYTLNPLPKQLGQKYGNKFPEIRKIVLGMDAEKTAVQLLGGEPIDIEINGEGLKILPEEVEVRVQAKEGYSVASEGAYLAALVTELTPDLIKEGLAREFVRRVQDLRKSAELDIADRIKLTYAATPGLLEAVNAFKEYILAETLTVEISVGEPPQGAASMEDEFDNERVTIHIIKA